MIVVVVVVADEILRTFSSFGRPRARTGRVVDQEENDQAKSRDETITQNRHHSLRVLHSNGARGDNYVVRDNRIAIGEARGRFRGGRAHINHVVVVGCWLLSLVVIVVGYDCYYRVPFQIKCKVAIATAIHGKKRKKLCYETERTETK